MSYKRNVLGLQNGRSSKDVQMESMRFYVGILFPKNITFLCKRGLLQNHLNHLKTCKTKTFSGIIQTRQAII